MAKIYLKKDTILYANNVIFIFNENQTRLVRDWLRDADISVLDEDTELFCPVKYESKNGNSVPYYKKPNIRLVKKL